ncbi:MAG: 2-oxoacid:acceptor oxidoreductase family protein [Clostridia bacterium]|nr:2-oxoacid:acceptor oxidoreductase family protein [Clostridia bacterium]
MSKDLNILLAGFGGQGILFAGKFIAGCAMIDKKQLSWLPSYGPEMRGGTANCSVCISDNLIGSPLVVNPNVFVAMNLPSFDKFINEVEPDSYVFVDSSLIHKKVERTDLKVFYVPATNLAVENNLKGLANMIMIGKMYKELKFCSEEAFQEELVKCIPPKKSHLLEFNKKALDLGINL